MHTAVQDGQTAHLVTSAGAIRIGDLTVTQQANNTTGGYEIVLSSAGNVDFPADMGTVNYAIMGSDGEKSAHTNLDAKFADLRTTTATGSKMGLYLNANVLGSQAGSLVVSGANTSTKAFKVATLTQPCADQSVTITVDQKAAFKTDGNMFRKSLDVSAGNLIQIGDEISQLNNATAKMTVHDRLNNGTRMEYEAGDEGAFDTTNQLTKKDANGDYRLLADQQIKVTKDGHNAMTLGNGADTFADKSGNLGTIQAIDDGERGSLGIDRRKLGRRPGIRRSSSPRQTSSTPSPRPPSPAAPASKWTR